MKQRLLLKKYYDIDIEYMNLLDIKSYIDIVGEIADEQKEKEEESKKVRESEAKAKKAKDKISHDRIRAKDHRRMF